MEKGSSHTLLLGVHVGADTMKTTWRFLKKVKVPPNPAVTTVKNSSRAIFIAALFTAATVWNQKDVHHQMNW